MKNKRILTYSEFDNEYGGKGKGGVQAGNDQASIDMFKGAADELDEPTLDSNSGMDSISSKPATRSIKTDYEATPKSPDGPAMATMAGDDSNGRVEKRSIEEVREKFKKSKQKRAERQDKTSGPIDAEETVKDEEDTIESTRKKKKLTSQQKDELKREMEGNY